MCIDEEKFIDLINKGIINKDTLVWNQDFKDWEIALNTDIFNIKEPPPVPYEENNENFESNIQNVRPWIRYWARLFDIFTISIFGSICLFFVFPELENVPDIGINILMIFVFIFLEPLMLSFWGTTPGKALLNVSINKIGKSDLSYSDCFVRCIKVWFYGMGMGLPLISLATQIVAYNKLNKNKITSWDEEEKFVISHQKIGFFRIIIFVIILFVYISIFAYGKSIQNSI